jgi:phosphoesterase RecJ-like protein
LSNVDWAPLADRLRKASRIVIGTHINADGDGLGCEIALHQFLSDLGRDVRIVNSEPVSPRYRFLKGSENIEVYEREKHSELIRNADLFIVLDNSSVERLARVREDVEATRAVKICIDHHSSVNRFWDLNCVDTDACASGQLICELVRHMGGDVTPGMAEALYVSFITDTGHFRFTKTTAETHRVVADLMDTARISPPRFYTEIYENTSAGMAALTGLALSGMKFEHAGRFAWMSLTRKQILDCRAEEEDTGDLVNLSLAVEGVLVGALFREMPDGKTKISLRSKGDIDVSALAISFNGGGHKNASGILMPVPINEAIRTLISRMGEYLPPEAAQVERRDG